MRLALGFSTILCFFMGIMGAIGAGAAWSGDDYVVGFLGVLVALFFIGLGARYAFFLGNMERERRFFFPRRHWWQF